MNIDEMKAIIARISALLNDEDGRGMATWHMLLGRAMDELISKWTAAPQSLQDDRSSDHRVGPDQLITDGRDLARELHEVELVFESMAQGPTRFTQRRDMLALLRLVKIVRALIERTELK